MAAINPAVELAKVRTKIDAQQQAIGRLEIELQRAILGGNTGTVDDIISGAGGIGEIYANSGVDDGPILEQAMREGIEAGGNLDDAADQDKLRQMLYQARALLGELRVEEQHWNQEVNIEKDLRKELKDMAKP
jgi:hypothetical protein